MKTSRAIGRVGVAVWAASGLPLAFDDGTNRQFMSMAMDSLQSLRFSALSGGDFYQALMLLDLANRMRDQANERNANLLGYVQEINRRNDITRLAGLGTAFDDLIQDIEEPRYYMVIAAYEMQAVLKGQHRLVWQTRVSIREQGNRFDQWTPAMLASAADYFGRESKRLVRQYQRATKVELGELKTLGIVEEPEIVAR